MPVHDVRVEHHEEREADRVGQQRSCSGWVPSARLTVDSEPSGLVIRVTGETRPV